jgi:hypothetical protein
MPDYARGTYVSIEKTRDELERLLDRNGAQAFAFMREPGYASIAFRLNDRNYVLRLRTPDVSEFSRTRTGRLRYESEAQKFHAQAVRARWRALLLLLRAKLIAVEDGITTVEDEFLSAAMLNDGQTVGQWAASMPQALSGRGPLLLPGSVE